MFESISVAPPDAIMGLTEAFKQDPADEKINLSIGVFKNDGGVTPILQCVKRAERLLLERETSKAYLSIDGHADYRRHVPRLVFGDQVPPARLAIVQTPGGTAALRGAGEFLRQMLPETKIWCSKPTWANHGNVFAAAGLEVGHYAFFDPATNGLAFEKMIDDFRKIPAGHAVLLHGCCHNPTGVDPSLEQWKEISRALAERKLLPLVDFAYQGFADGLREDAAGPRCLLEHHDELIVCNSFSKNFGLYNERVGALAVMGKTAQVAEAVLSQLKRLVRCNYSNPPFHGAAIVATVLNDQDLTALWQDELAGMRDRINAVRQLFVRKLADTGVDRDFSFIRRQRGMFSFTGLTQQQVDRLREEYSIYIVGSGRINVAGITEQNVDRLVQSIAKVL